MNSKAVIITSFVIFIICFTVHGLILGPHITSNRLNKDVIEKKLEVDRKAFEAIGIEPEQIEIVLKVKEKEYKGKKEIRLGQKRFCLFYMII